MRSVSVMTFFEQELAGNHELFGDLTVGRDRVVDGILHALELVLVEASLLHGNPLAQDECESGQSEADVNDDQHDSLLR